jgi:four helix bundle protein
MSSSYRDLRVWQQAMDLAERVYLVTENFPRQEMYGLTAQLHRSAVSVPSNIAEGKGRNTDRDFLNFLFHARGSLMELETQLMLAARLRFIKQQDATDLLKATARVGSSLAGLINSMREISQAAGT